MKPIAFLFVTLLFSTPVLSKKVHITLLQANDVYEIAPVNGGKYGGLARVQTLINRLKAKNRHTYTLLAGDLISPSAIGTAKINGQRLNGKQMINVLNAMQWDFITLGNHEFDNGRDVLLSRLSEAKFKTVSSNVVDADTGKPFMNTQITDVFTVDGVRVALAGITLQSLAKDFVNIEDPLITAKKTIANLKNKQSADIVILLTHQDIEGDIAFANELADVDLIVGGHEHENSYFRRGINFVPIAKADANARTVYIHELYYDTVKKVLTVDSTLTIIDDQLPEDPGIKNIVNGWLDIAFKAFEQEGFQPEQVVTMTTEVLDGLEANVRNGSTRLTELVASSALVNFPEAEISLINAGSMRIDDVLPVGPVTEYDVIRVLPFGGTYIEVSIPGELLIKTFNVGIDNKGTGGFLHHTHVTLKDGVWFVKDKAIDKAHEYRVAIASFLISDGDSGLEFLTTDPRIKTLSDKKVDAREALISELKRVYPSS